MVMAVSAAELRRERHGGQFGLRRPAMMGSRRGADRCAAGFVGRWDVVECFGIWHRDRISLFSCCVVPTLCGYASLPWAGGGGGRAGAVQGRC